MPRTAFPGQGHARCLRARSPIGGYLPRASSDCNLGMGQNDTTRLGPFNRVPFWAPLFDPQPLVEHPQLHASAPRGSAALAPAPPSPRRPEPQPPRDFGSGAGGGEEVGGRLLMKHLRGVLQFGAINRTIGSTFTVKACHCCQAQGKPTPSCNEPRVNAAGQMFEVYYLTMRIRLTQIPSSACIGTHAHNHAEITQNYTSFSAPM